MEIGKQGRPDSTYRGVVKKIDLARKIKGDTVENKEAPLRCLSQSGTNVQQFKGFARDIFGSNVQRCKCLSGRAKQK